MPKPTIDQAISVFRGKAAFRGWQYPEGAQGECSNASHSFVNLGQSLGIVIKIRPLIGLPGYVRDTRLADDTPDELHVINEWGEALSEDALYIDWTRRQYQSDANWPHIATKQELEMDGWRMVTMQEAYDWCSRVREMQKSKRLPKPKLSLLDS